VVSLTDNEARINNEMKEELGWEYVLEKPEKSKPGPKPKN
jgi:hypothetical protein